MNQMLIKVFLLYNIKPLIKIRYETHYFRSRWFYRECPDKRVTKIKRVSGLFREVTMVLLARNHFGQILLPMKKL